MTKRVTGCSIRRAQTLVADVKSGCVSWPEGQMRVVIQKVDMDTCLTGLILGAEGAAELVVRSDGATSQELADPAVLCIEAGGSGDVARSNFDHHGPGAPDDPACVQAAGRAGLTDSNWLRLVAYVAAVDVGSPIGSGRAAFPTLSNVFSGMMLVEHDGRARFQAGMAMMRHVVETGIDPCGTMPERPEWAAFVEAKRLAQGGLSQDLETARLFQTSTGAQAGFVASGHPGALGGLYELGCRYGVAFAENFRTDDGATIRKFTIGASRGSRVDLLLPALNELDPGWGGPSHGTIIGSPRPGSSLSVETVCDLVGRYC